MKSHLRSWDHSPFIVCVLAVIALCTVSTAQARRPLPAQVGTVTVGGTPAPGGAIDCQFNLNALTSGVVVAKASVKGKRWKANFPVLTESVSIGTNSMVSATVPVPTNFLGRAVLQLKVYFNRKRVASRAITVTITNLPPLPAGPTNVKLYDVGFNTVVTLDGTVVPVSALGTPVTYAWSQFQGPPVALSATDAVKPTFTTGALTNFVTLSGGLGVVPFATLDIGEDGNGDLDSYGFQVVASDGFRSVTGNVIVCVASLSPGLTTVPVGVKSHLQTSASETSNSWTLVTAPAASHAALVGTNTPTPWLQPDVEGQYVVRDNVQATNLTLTAASFTGVQFCGICHGPNSNVGQADLVTPWSQTGHATMFQRGIDGILDPGYNESCFFCHTVGYNKQAAVTNGCFGDVQASLGWTLPQPLQAGDYTAMPAALQNKANIQCESCHGPGSQHPTAPTLAVAACAPCHQENTSDNFRVGEWASSPHAQTDNASQFSHAINSCATRCHNPQGFVNAAKGVALPTTPAIGKMTCAVCHDPHNAAMFPADAHQVRIYDTVTLGDVTKTNSVNPNGAVNTNSNGTVVLTNQGANATCLACHNGLALAYQNTGSATNGVPEYMNGLPHESPVAEVFNGVGGADNGVGIGNSYHTHLAGCVTCHMDQIQPPTQNADGSFTPVDTILVGNTLTPVDDSNWDEYFNILGFHTFAMSATDGTNVVENIASCNRCHGTLDPVDQLDFKSVIGGDYDGDGVVAGVQTEVQGLLGVLSNKFAQAGVAVYDSYPFVNSSTLSVSNAVAFAAERRALWNRVLILKDGSFGVHNTQFAVRLLQSSYTDLSTNTLSRIVTNGVTVTLTNGNPFRVDYPRAMLR